MVGSVRVMATHMHASIHTLISTIPGIDNGKLVFLYIPDLVNKLVFDVDTGQPSILHLQLSKFYEDYSALNSNATAASSH